jgi:cell division protease FtsH
VAALGYTLQLPTEDRFLMTKSELENRIAVLLGGRVAEELIFHEASTGARDDLVKATDIAKSMIKAYGMSEKLGKVSFDRNQQAMFLQTGQGPAPAEYSDEIAREIDLEVRQIIDNQHARTTSLLSANLEALHKAAEVLLSKETITGQELMAIANSSNTRGNKLPSGVTHSAASG